MIKRWETYLTSVTTAVQIQAIPILTSNNMTQGLTNKLQGFFIFRQFRQKANRQGERIFKLKRILHCAKRFFFLVNKFERIH
jgi:hypothetical protein